MLKKLITGFLAAAMFISSVACVSYATDNTYEMKVADGITFTNGMDEYDSQYFSIVCDGITGNTFMAGHIELKVISNRLSDNIDNGAYGVTTKDGMTYTVMENRQPVVKHLDYSNINIYYRDAEGKVVRTDETDGYDKASLTQYLVLPWAYPGITASSDVVVEFYVTAEDTTKDVVFEFLPESFIQVYSDDLDARKIYYTTGSKQYKLEAGKSTVTEITSGGSEEPGDDTTPIIGGNADREAAEAFTDYADATAVGKYEGVTSDDQATAFWAELKNGTAAGEQATTGNIVWKVTSNGTSKYFKKSVGNAIAGGGSAKVGLIVQNLYDDNATAGIAFLQ